jgi:hypothetical protein
MVPAPALSRLLAVQPLLDAVERDQAAPRATFDRLVIGQLVIGEVKSQAKEIALVIIEGQTVAMRLPYPVRTGDHLKLSFAGHTPQPLFLLESPETLSAEAPQLSQTARMLSELFQRVPQHALPTLTPATPLLPKPPINTGELALVLRTALVRSGLFYESHLANWTVGKDSLDGLMQEPQNRRAAEAGRSGSVLGLSDISGPPEPRSTNPMHTLLSQQLQVLESPHFIWRGDLWPGRTLEWQVRQETQHQDEETQTQDSRSPHAQWESHLKLTLPELGTLNVHIKLDAQQAFSIRMVPEKPEIGTLLQQHQPELTGKLVAAGCLLHAVTVQCDGNA